MRGYPYDAGTLQKLLLEGAALSVPMINYRRRTMIQVEGTGTGTQEGLGNVGLSSASV